MMQKCPEKYRRLRALTDAKTELMTGIELLGRAAFHAYEAGDITDEEAADFVEATINPLIDEFAAAAK